jgi:hypothetical protein
MRTLLDPTAGHHLYLASITGVEVIAAVTRRLRRGDIAVTDGAAAVAQFRQDFAQRYRLIDLTPLLVARAMTSAETMACAAMMPCNSPQAWRSMCGGSRSGCPR